MSSETVHPALHSRAGCAFCACLAATQPRSPRRRLFTQALLVGGATAAVPALARGGDLEGEIEEAAAQQYRQLLAKASQQKALAPASHPQVIRLRAIAQRIIPNSYAWNERARRWQWEVNLLGSTQLNAFCMPGGKIAFYFGILKQLQLSDDEVAMIMGHEAAHALREHARKQMQKSQATQLGASLISQLFGLGSLGNMALGAGAQVLTLKFSRGDESEADVVGMELAARSGYDPRSGVTLWQKMLAAAKGAPPEFFSTHPAGATRIQDIESNLPKAMPLYERAPKPPTRYGPPAK